MMTLDEAHEFMDDFWTNGPWDIEAQIARGPEWNARFDEAGRMQAEAIGFGLW